MTKKTGVRMVPLTEIAASLVTAGIATKDEADAATALMGQGMVSHDKATAWRLKMTEAITTARAAFNPTPKASTSGGFKKSGTTDARLVQMVERGQFKTYAEAKEWNDKFKADFLAIANGTKPAPSRATLPRTAPFKPVTKEPTEVEKAIAEREERADKMEKEADRLAKMADTAPQQRDADQYRARAHELMRQARVLRASPAPREVKAEDPEERARIKEEVKAAGRRHRQAFGIQDERDEIEDPNKKPQPFAGIADGMPRSKHDGRRPDETQQEYFARLARLRDGK